MWLFQMYNMLYKSLQVKSCSLLNDIALTMVLTILAIMVFRNWDVLVTGLKNVG